MQVVHELLLPVLNDVRESATESQADEPVEQKLGAGGGGGGGGSGGGEMMMIHHSRNTVGKQWHATWDTAFQGVTRMFKTFFPIITSLSTAQVVCPRARLPHLGAPRGSFMVGGQ